MMIFCITIISTSCVIISVIRRKQRTQYIKPDFDSQNKYNTQIEKQTKSKPVTNQFVKKLHTQYKSKQHQKLIGSPLFPGKNKLERTANEEESNFTNGNNTHPH